LAQDLGTAAPSEFDENLERAFLAAALCHDIGHTAYSHALETVLLPAKTASENNGTVPTVRNHEDCTLLLLQADLELTRRIREVCDADQVLQFLKGDHWVDGLCKLLSGPIDVDRADYLLRDTRAAGLVYGLHDLDWMIRSVFLWPDQNRRLRLVFDSARGLVALRHFLAARRSMYQQVYWHRTVRGAEQVIRAMFERAITIGSGLGDTMEGAIPWGLKTLLREGRHGKRPTIEEFLATDDVAVLAIIKLWARSSEDSLLRYLAQRFLQRRLPKEVQLPKEIHWWSGDIPSDTIATVRGAVRDALRRRAIPDLPPLAEDQLEEALDYFVLGDRCEFKEEIELEGLLFSAGGDAPIGLNALGDRPEREIGHGASGFRVARLYVPEELKGTVQAALGRRT
jgi:HD superfamily phosphohydrolase